MIKVYKHYKYHYDFECVFKFLDVEYVSEPVLADYVALSGNYDETIFKDINERFNVVYSYMREARIDNIDTLYKQFSIRHPKLTVFSLTPFDIFNVADSFVFDQFELDAYYRIFYKKECRAAKPTGVNKFLFLGGKPNKPNRQPLYDLLDKAKGICTLHNLNSPDNAIIENNHYLGYPYEDWLYNETSISLIAETHYKNDEIFFPTEKTYRAIANLHPFVIASTPKFLNNLRKKGYETFNTIFDESYDDELDDNLRLTKIVNSLNNSIKIPYDKYKEICEHNKSVLISNAQNTLRLIQNKLQI